MAEQIEEGKPDRDRINVGEDYEVRYWADPLKEAVRKVGPMFKDVATPGQVAQ